MKNYLCFGDSNTWGYIPNTDAERYPIERRICGVLQTRLGSDVRVIEEAHNGRTTHYDDPLEADKNGGKQLPIILDSHRPLDLISVMLGTNDLKHHLKLNAIDSAMGINALIEIIRGRNCGVNGSAPEIIIVSPPHYIDTTRPFGRLFEGADQKSLEFADAYREIAKRQGVHFLDASLLATPPESGDGVHIDSVGGTAIGNGLADYIQEKLGW